MVTISAVVTTYNRRYEVVRAIKSIYAQTILPNEIIVIDNGSNDGTLDYIRQFHFSNIKLIDSREFNVGNGIGIARNLGTKLATCDYIAFLDSDNEWYKNKIELFKNKIEDVATKLIEPDIVFSHYYYHEKSYRLERPTAFDNGLNNTLPMPYRSLLQRYADGSASMYRKAFLDEIRGFDERLQTNVDWELLLRANFSNGKAINRSIIEIKDILSENHTMFDSLEEDYERELCDRLDLINQYKCCIHGIKEEYPSIISELYDIYIREINVRMDRMMAVDELIRTLNNVEDSIDIINKLLEDNKTITANLSRRDSFRGFESKWLNNKINGIHIEDNLEAMGIRRIAIYGAGNYGKMLYRELNKSTKVEIAYYIDRNKEAMLSIDESIKVYSLEDELPEVDKIVITPFLEWNSIRRALEIKGLDNIIAVCDIV